MLVSVLTLPPVCATFFVKTLNSQKEVNRDSTREPGITWYLLHKQEDLPLQTETQSKDPKNLLLQRGGPEFADQVHTQTEVAGTNIKIQELDNDM